MLKWRRAMLVHPASCLPVPSLLPATAHVPTRCPTPATWIGPPPYPQAPAWPSMTRIALPPTACAGTPPASTCCCRLRTTPPSCCTTCGTPASRCTAWQGMRRAPGARRDMGVLASLLAADCSQAGRDGSPGVDRLATLCLQHGSTATCASMPPPRAAGLARSTSPALWPAVTPWPRAASVPSCSRCTAPTPALPSAGAMRA